MTFEEWLGEKESLDAKGRQMYLDWKADHDKLLARIAELEAWVKSANPWKGETAVHDVEEFYQDEDAGDE